MAGKRYGWEGAGTERAAGTMRGKMLENFPAMQDALYNPATAPHGVGVAVGDEQV